MYVIVSSCLLGKKCRYDGTSAMNSNVLKFLEGKNIITVCPEILCGLSTPRDSVEICNNKIIDCNGKDVDELYIKGVALAVEQIYDLDIDMAILKSKSPTCGVNYVYDGAFSGKLVPGNGIFTAELLKKGIKVFDETLGGVNE